MQRRFQKQYKEIKDIEAKNTKVDEEIKQVIKKDIMDINYELKQKTSNEETVKVWKNFQNYAEYNDLKDLYQKVIPQVSRFEDTLMDLEREMRKTQEIIRRFDEIVSEKSSKHDFRELEIRLE